MDHWLNNAARRASLAGADLLRVPEGVTEDDAWRSVTRALGMSTNELVQRLAPAVGVKVANFDLGEARALTLLPERLARRYNVFPLRENDRTLTVATSNPLDLQIEQAISFASARRAVFELAPPSAVTEAINAGYSPDRAVEQMLSSVDDHVSDAVKIVEETAPEVVAERDVAAGPVVKLTSLIIRDAVLSRASDVHIEPGPKGGAVRFRVDGVLRVYMQLPMGALNRIVSRIKVLAKLDIADRIRPQDGRARVRVEENNYDLRVSTVPTRDAEKCVIRVLRPDAVKSLETSGLSSDNIESIRDLLGTRDGIVLVTGPTGSGKTTTLYAALREVAQRSINIITVEDPIEYELSSITQMQVEEKRGMTFANALRAVLRQDPDVIFVGEIRDVETAEVAVQAALTGHLVLASLHTNEALSAVTRLEDLGLGRASIAASLRGAIAQRLVRKICPSCSQRIENELTPDEQRLTAAYGVRPLVREIGCEACSWTGYRGRMPIMEIVDITPAMSEMIASEASVATMQRAATSSGMMSLLDSALERVRAGETTLQEVARVVGEPANEATPAAEAAKPTTDENVGPTVLVVDDDPVLRALASKLLADGGYRVLTANDGREAMHCAQSGENISLVVTDLQMPTMNGWALLASLRAEEATSQVPVIVLTSSDDNGDEVRLMDAGADDYIRKPIDSNRFVARVRAALRRANY